MGKIKVGKAEHINEGEAKIVEAEGKQVAVFNTKGKFWAISNVCAHKGGPLGEGMLAEETITCPWHGWEYDIKTGKCLNNEAKVESYKVTVEDGEVFVEIE